MWKCILEGPKYILRANKHMTKTHAAFVSTEKSCWFSTPSLRFTFFLGNVTCHVHCCLYFGIHLYNVDNNQNTENVIESCIRNWIELAIPESIFRELFCSYLEKISYIGLLNFYHLLTLKLHFDLPIMRHLFINQVILSFSKLKLVLFVCHCKIHRSSMHK